MDSPSTGMYASQLTASYLIDACIPKMDSPSTGVHASQLTAPWLIDACIPKMDSPSTGVHVSQPTSRLKTYHLLLRPYRKGLWAFADLPRYVLVTESGSVDDVDDGH